MAQFMYLFRGGGYATPRDISPTELQAHLAKWNAWSNGLYALSALSPSPVVALNRALALAEHRGLAAGRAALLALDNDPKLAEYSFYWAARADIERRSRHLGLAAQLYGRAMEHAKSRAERLSYERRLHALGLDQTL